MFEGCGLAVFRHGSDGLGLLLAVAALCCQLVAHDQALGQWAAQQAANDQTICMRNLHFLRGKTALVEPLLF